MVSSWAAENDCIASTLLDCDIAWWLHMAVSEPAIYRSVGRHIASAFFDFFHLAKVGGSLGQRSVSLTSISCLVHTWVPTTMFQSL